jgi:shikimate kinase
MKLGEEGFRALETQVLAALQNVQSCIIAVGGGMILHRSNVEILEKMGQLIYLSLDKEALKKRVLSSPLPAYLDPIDPEGSFDRMYEKRKTIYERVRAVRIDVSNKPDEVVLEELAAAIKE